MSVFMSSANDRWDQVHVGSDSSDANQRGGRGGGGGDGDHRLAGFSAAPMQGPPSRPAPGSPPLRSDHGDAVQSRAAVNVRSSARGSRGALAGRRGDSGGNDNRSRSSLRQHPVEHQQPHDALQEADSSVATTTATAATVGAWPLPPPPRSQSQLSPSARAWRTADGSEQDVSRRRVTVHGAAATPRAGGDRKGGEVGGLGFARLKRSIWRRGSRLKDGITHKGLPPAHGGARVAEAATQPRPSSGVASTGGSRASSLSTGARVAAPRLFAAESDGGGLLMWGSASLQQQHAPASSSSSSFA